MAHKQTQMNGYLVSKKFYDLFFDTDDKFSLIDYLNNSYCDEMGEVDLNKNHYEVIYHVKNKYLGAITDGSYSSLFNHVLNEFIYPDDVEIYDSLLNPEKILDRLEKAEHKHFDFIHYRNLLADGSYRWVELAVITGEEYGFEKGVFRFYQFDIQNVKLREEGSKAGDEGYVLINNYNELTGLYNEVAFFGKVSDLATLNPDVKYAILSIDIQHFKLFDEWFGREKGNFLLSKIGVNLRHVCEKYNGQAGYFGQDDFSVVIPFNMKYIQGVYDAVNDAIKSFNLSVGFLPAIGVGILDPGSDIKAAFDKASIASLKAKSDVKQRIYVYDETMHVEAEKEFRILLDFFEALKNNEITFYLQPQCRISSKKIVGAEALARWIKPNGEMVYPNDFIPILEKYGYISELDKYLWDKVCVLIKKMIEDNRHVVPISINISRVDILSFDVEEYINGLVKKYDFPKKYLKLEITESAYIEADSRVRELVKSLRKNGYMVLMDDFGSGYSSLNMLGTIEVDAVKLDAEFLNFGQESQDKGIHIIESIINMTKLISIPIIMEGVENQKQVDFLVDLGCRYIQGYYFYRPMEISKFEDLISIEDNVDKRGFVAKVNDQFRLREFLDKNVYSDAMLNNILGAVAIYAYNGKQLDIIRFNQQFYESVNVPDFNERLTNIERFMPEEDIEPIYEALDRAYEDKLNGASGLFRFFKTDGTVTTYLMKFYFIGEQDGFKKYYGSANNITVLAELEQKMSLISKYSSDTIIFLKRIKDQWVFDVASHGLAKETGIPKDELERDLNNGSIFDRLEKRADISAKNILLKLLGRKSDFHFVLSFINRNNEKIVLHLKGNYVDETTTNVEYILTFRLLNED